MRRIKIPSGGGGTDRWLDCISQKIAVSEGIAELSCFVDTTYYEQRQVSDEQRSDFYAPDRFDETTGLLTTAAVRQELGVQISRMLRDKLRWVDIRGCWGRNEFLLVLPGPSVEPATNLAKKICSQVERLKSLQSADDMELPVVIGVSEWRRGDDPKKLVARVERELQSNVLS